MSSTQPLQGITVVEIGHTVAAPYAGMVLAELGADVIKVESPGVGDYSRGMPPFRDGKSAVYQALNRGKRSIALDMADPAQAEKLRGFIVEKADVVMHNLKFGAMAKLGFDSAALLKAKPSFASGNVPKREGSGLAQIVPYQAFAAADAYIMVAAGNDNLFRKLCAAVQREDLAIDVRFVTNKDRVGNRTALIEILERIFVTQDAAHWLSRLAALDVPCSPINTIDQVVEDAQTKALGIFQQSPDGTETLLGLPLMFDGVRPPFKRSAPNLGEHNSDVL